MCWSSVTCSRLVSYAHWPLGRGEALMFGDFFAAKEFSRTSDCCGQTYNLKSLLGKYSGIWIFFFFGEHLCVSWRWTESCGWRKTPLSIPSRSYFSCFAQLLWVNSLSVMSALLWWNLLLQHLDLLKHFSKLCLESFLFFFYSHTHSPFLWKRSRGTNRSVTQISITPCWVCEISCCRDWSLVQSSLKRRMSLSLVGMSPTWNTRELIGQASNSLAVPRNET